MSESTVELVLTLLSDNKIAKGNKVFVKLIEKIVRGKKRHLELCSPASRSG